MAERSREETRMDPAERLLEEIREDARQTGGRTGRPELSERVLAAFARVPRERFVPEDVADLAWLDRPLPIGHGQTISQPFIVALMTDLLDPEPGDRVLEVGTGSGYQAAILAGLVAEVRSVEVVPELAERARTVLAELGYGNVHLRTGDGWYGWPEAGPYDGILVTAVARAVPPELVAQLAPGARLVLPVGEPGGHQELVLVTREADGRWSEEPVLPVQFVPLTGDH
jgi:protein-L-isoaspartate(D-aspartate) O-methyltransferase